MDAITRAPLSLSSYSNPTPIHVEHMITQGFQVLTVRDPGGLYMSICWFIETLKCWEGT